MKERPTRITAGANTSGVNAEDRYADNPEANTGFQWVLHNHLKIAHFNINYNVLQGKFKQTRWPHLASN